jgi:twitching motility protein PilJ
LQLLDDISDLADGDLTVEATVTEDFTGTIADSINFAIAELRSLVQNVASSSEKVASSTAATRSVSLQLADSAEHQAQEIAGVSAAINEMAITIDQVSSNSAESSAVAEGSVSIAKNGAQVVRNTIEGMDTIREQIQDTSKRIKRLGESSQEIGDIVSLINEIADQTNILALNAAIQAAMAGEAGRGFAVVADEVQRLAERSATATKQIAGLVKTIQTDTHEAVASMEQTTAEVVKGAELANSAGTALEEIETVSTNLAELIQDISEAAKHQATTSSHISNTMNIIQEITSQTLSGTNDTATSIGDLAEMAIEMRESVSGFILPDTSQPIIPEESDEIEGYQENYDETDGESSNENDEPNGASGIDASPEQIAEFSLVDEDDHEIEEGHEFDSEATDFAVNGIDKTDINSDKKRLGESEFDEDEDPFHLEKFEAEIEALLSDNDKKQ